MKEKKISGDALGRENGMRPPKLIASSLNLNSYQPPLNRHLYSLPRCRLLYGPQFLQTNSSKKKSSLWYVAA